MAEQKKVRMVMPVHYVEPNTHLVYNLSPAEIEDAIGDKGKVQGVNYDELTPEQSEKLQKSHGLEDVPTVVQSQEDVKGLLRNAGHNVDDPDKEKHVSVTLGHITDIIDGCSDGHNCSDALADVEEINGTLNIVFKNHQQFPLPSCFAHVKNITPEILQKALNTEQAQQVLKDNGVSVDHVRVISNPGT
jgi:hypothetical protein